MSFTRAARRAGRHRRPVGLGEVDAAAPDGHARSADLGHGARDRSRRRRDVGSRALGAARRRASGSSSSSSSWPSTPTVLENVADGLLYSGATLRPRRAQAAEALAGSDSLSAPRFRPTQLSGGERQRVAIARALVGGRRSCSPTSRPATSTARPAPRSSRCSRRSSRRSHDRRDHPRPRPRRATTAPGRDARRPDRHRHRRPPHRRRLGTRRASA